MNIVKEFKSQLDGLTKIKELEDGLKRAVEDSALQVAYDSIKLSTERISEYTSVLQSSEWQTIRERINSLKIPQLSKPRKQALLASYEAWGKIGWTLDPEEELAALFACNPGLEKEADRKALSKVKVDRVIEAILEDPRVKRTDIEEAIHDFEDKRYKSCALILFSLIDAQLIRLQKKPKDPKKRRPSGAGALPEVRKRSGIGAHDEWLLSALFYVNVFACIETVFASGNDFKKQPSVINRNFVAHGMLWNKVTRKNCIQLLLLYYNMLEMLDFLYSS